MILRACYFGILFIIPIWTNGQLEPEIFSSGFTQPVDIANAGDGSSRLFIVEKPGVIRILDKNGQLQEEPFLDIRSKVDNNSSEEGLLGLAFHPHYVQNGYFFVYYTESVNGQRMSRIERYRVSGQPHRADPLSGEMVLSFPQPQQNHNGGDLNFGPEGYLYIGVGDGGSGNDPGERAQDLTLHLGKLLRIQVNQLPYSIPPDNPFFTSTGDTVRSIWAWGLRNPWRFSFDQNGDLWIADVGQIDREEINYIQADQHRAGLNYGWDCREGNIACPGCNNLQCEGKIFTEPIYWYGPGPGLSITGGYVLRGRHYPNFQGRYVFADYATDEFFSLKINNDGAVSVSNPIFLNNISTFGLDEENRVYAASLSGTIYRIKEKGLLERDLFNARISANKNKIKLEWEIDEGFPGTHFEIERSFLNGPFQRRHEISFSQQNYFTWEDAIDFPEYYRYRIKLVSDSSGWSRSLLLTPNYVTEQFRIEPNPSDGILTFHWFSAPGRGQMCLLNSSGEIIRQWATNDWEERETVQVIDQPAGLYLLHWRSEKGNVDVQRLILH